MVYLNGEKVLHGNASVYSSFCCKTHDGNASAALQENMPHEQSLKVCPHYAMRQNATKCGLATW